MQNQYRLIAKNDLVELLSNLTAKYSKLDPDSGDRLQIARLKSEIRAIQKEIFKRREGSPDNSRDQRQPSGAPGSFPASEN